MLSGHPPFYDLPANKQIASEVKKGERPSEPQCDASVNRGLTTEWWKLITDCWAPDPKDRPGASTVFNRLHCLPGRRDDERVLGDVGEIIKARKEFRRKEDNPFALLLKNGDLDSPELCNLKHELNY